MLVEGLLLLVMIFRPPYGEYGVYACVLALMLMYYKIMTDAVITMYGFGGF